MTLKEKVHNYYSVQIQDKIDVFRDMIFALTEDSKNDAKGSAGDKHETALSMMHIEQEKLNRKLSEYMAQKTILFKINPSLISQNVSLGSLVEVNGFLFYLSTALPKIVIENKTVFALSPQSPLGSKLMGNKIGFSAEVNNTIYCIESIN